MLGLYESISALAAKVNRLCCAVQQIQNNEGVSYLKYVAVLGQIDEDAPQVTVLENTIGDIVWTRASTGDYRGTLVGGFPENKTWCSAISGANYGNTVVLFLTRDTNDILRFLSKNLTTGSDQDINSNDPGIVYECSIEIRVYP